MSGWSSACKNDLLNHLLMLDSKEHNNLPVAHKAQGWNNAGLLVLIFMSKGIGESTLYLYIICKQRPFYNNFGDRDGIVFYGFVGSTVCYVKLYHDIPGSSFRSRLIHLGP